MKFNEFKDDFYMSEEPEEVRAAMQEENCAPCLGCPHATVISAMVVKMAHMSFNEVEKLVNSNELVPDESISIIIRAPEDALQKYREELDDLTNPCVGWLDGAGTNVAPRPRMMCNSPTSGDYKISIAAGWILEKLAGTNP